MGLIRRRGGARVVLAGNPHRKKRGRDHASLKGESGEMFESRRAISIASSMLAWLTGGGKGVAVAHETDETLPAK